MSNGAPHGSAFIQQKKVAMEPRGKKHLTTASTRTTTMATTTATIRKEKMYVLYGSQTGNSEQAAKDFCNQVSTKLSPSMIQTLTSSPIKVEVEPIHMQLDDFLELQRCTWTRLIIIFTSSYGVGQAPLGAYRFRELCDFWYEQYNDSNSTEKKILDGLYFAMCGLGDSKYTTFFHNPTRIHDALQLAGAKRVGPLGKADASGTGDDLQSTVIDQWINDIWLHLAQVLVQDPPLSQERLVEMEMATVALCQKINPDFEPTKDNKARNTSTNRNNFIAQVLIVLVAIGIYFYFSVYHYHSQQVAAAVSK